MDSLVTGTTATIFRQITDGIKAFIGGDFLTVVSALLMIAIIMLAISKIAYLIGEFSDGRIQSARNKQALSAYGDLEAGEERLERLQGLERELYKKQLSKQKSRFINDHGDSFENWVEQSDDEASASFSKPEAPQRQSSEIPYHSCSEGSGAYVDDDSEEARKKEIPY